MLSSLTHQLVDALQKLPGIGQKSAQRLAFRILSPDFHSKAAHLSTSITEALDKITRCSLCRNYTEKTCCDMCTNSKRNAAQICIVETPTDAWAIEQSHQFKGLYFILHGHLSPLDGIGPKDLGLPLFFDRLQKGDIHEVIMATNPTMEGESTAHYIASHLAQYPIKCTRIAHGVPMGGELEYLDSMTLSHALNTRLEITLSTNEVNNG